MKIIKGLLYSILTLILLLCAVVLVCAFNPALTDKLAAMVADYETDKGDGDGFEVQIPGNVQNQIGTGVYVPPAQEDVASPESVKGKNGYQPVQENGEQLEDEDADHLQGRLETGETGEDFTFDELFYPYYAMLDKDMRLLYRQIYANAMDLNTSFAPAVKVSADQVKSVFEAVYNDHPELFWLETKYSCKYRQGGECVELTLQYHKIAEDLETAQKQFEAAAKGIIAEAEELPSDVEKEKYVHNALIEKVDYHVGTAMNQSAYSALVNGRTVCAGYARAFQYVMMELGIPCYYCTGYSGEDHAWNIVKLDDGYYNVDVTWDDTKPFTYDYFNKTDADYAKTHMRKGLSVYLPVCLGGEYHSSATGDVLQSGMTDSDEGGDNTTDVGLSDADSLINKNPQEPLTWDSVSGNDPVKDELKELGLYEEDILDDLTEYYADCLKQMTEAGKGQQQFTNVIPKSLWDTIERIYSDGSYKTGYVNEALKKLGMENFAIQLQTERLSGRFYKLYHNISTW